MAWNTAINELKRPAAMLVIALINSETADDMVGAMIIVCDSVAANFIAIAVLGGAYYFYTNSQRGQRSGRTGKIGKN